MTVIVTYAENESDDYGQVMTVKVSRSEARFVGPQPDAKDYPRDLVEGLAKWAGEIQ